MHFNKLSIVYFLFLTLALSCVKSTSLFSFTHQTDFFFQLDLQDGDLIVNQTLYQTLKYYQVINYDSNSQEFTLFVSNGSMYDDGINYMSLKYSVKHNRFFDESESVLVNAQFVYTPLFQTVNNVYYVPIVLDSYQRFSMLTIDFNHNSSDIIDFEIEDFNLGYYPSSNYNNQTNKLYTLYFGSNGNPYIQALNLPINNGSENGQQIYKFKSNLPILSNLNPIGQLFSVANNEELYYITRINDNLVICLIDLENLDCDTVFSIANQYTNMYTPYFFSYENSEMISVQEILDEKSNPIGAEYQIVDLNNFKIKNTYKSADFYSSGPNSLDNFFYYINVDNFPPSLTLTKGSTVLFIVGLNTGDHIIFTKETPPDVKPFTSPVLNFNRLQPSFSYTFTDIGKYIIMDMYTLEKMNLTIIEKSSTTTSITTSTSFEGSTNSLTSSSISSSNHTISSLENNSLNNSTTTTPTSHEKNVSLKLNLGTKLLYVNNPIFSTICIVSIFSAPISLVYTLYRQFLRNDTSLGNAIIPIIPFIAFFSSRSIFNILKKGPTRER
ncbi:hypothetical protein RB653_003269 [Dictyostelium firmibasis]|uniref:Uncharacterized protein n=1 Tax=Dictyostelium firmibasis TaxID=79012 RepID=A0AAN7UBV6_9MYCE